VLKPLPHAALSPDSPRRLDCIIVLISGAFVEAGEFWGGGKLEWNGDAVFEVGEMR